MLRSKIRELRARGGGAVGGAVGISASLGIGQVVFLLISPLLTRLYSPSDFGLYTVLTSAIIVLAVVSTLRMEIAVPLARSDRDARRVVSTAIAAALVICLVALFFALFADRAIADAFGEAGIARWLWIVPVSAFFYGAYEVVSQYAIRHKKYGILGKRSLIQNLAMSVAQVGGGFAGVSGGLLVGQLIGKFSAIAFTFSSEGLATSSFVRDISLKNSRQSLKLNWRFPAFLMPSALLNTLGTQAPFVFIGLLYGAPIVGLLGLTQRILGAPAALVSQAVSSVYMGESSNRMRANSASNLSLFAKATAVLVTISAPFFVLVYVLAPLVLTPLFGEQWSGMVAYTQAMTVAVFLQFVVSPVSQTMVINGAQVAQFSWDLGRAVAVMLAIYGSYWLGWNALSAVWAYSITSAACYVILWAMCLLKVRAVHARNVQNLAIKGRGVSQIAAASDDLHPDEKIEN